MKLKETFELNGAKATLYLGDAQEVKRLVPRGSVLVSDPPFNVGYHYRSYKDRMPAPEYLNWLSDIFTGSPHVLILYPETLHAYTAFTGAAPNKVVSWVYNANTPRQHRDIGFYGVSPDFTRVGQPYKNPKDKRVAKRIAEGKMARLYDWWEVNQVKNVSKEKTPHPCQMPSLVMDRVVGILPGSPTVYDPFTGSGTTLVACLGRGVNSVGAELDPEYFEIACERLHELANA